MEKYMYGQGSLVLAEIISATVDGPWVDVGDVSSLEGTMSETMVQHRESRSGRKGLVRNFPIEQGMVWNAVVHQIDVDQIARFGQGTVTSSIAGSVSGEPLPADLVVGDIVTLDEFGPTDLVIMDSAATPVALDPEHYSFNVYGDVEILSLPDPAPTQPFTASYSYAAKRQVAMLNSKRRQFRLRYKAKNLAEGEEPFVLELYKLDAGLLQTLSLITSGNQLAQAPVAFTSLVDTTKPMDGELGQYGRLIEIGESA